LETAKRPSEGLVRPRTKNQYRGGTERGGTDEVPRGSTSTQILTMGDCMAATRGRKLASRACSLWGVVIPTLLLEVDQKCRPRVGLFPKWSQMRCFYGFPRFRHTRTPCRCRCRGRRGAAMGGGDGGTNGCAVGGALSGVSGPEGRLRNG
jgi:hypothetical protein